MRSSDLPLLFLKSGRKAFVVLTIPNKLTFMILWYISIVQKSMSPRKLTPALLTSAHNPISRKRRKVEKKQL